MRQDLGGKAVAIKLRNFSSVQMRTFHMAWMAFFLAFFGWFGIAPMMALVRDDLALTKSQIGDTVIASVAGTVIARLVIGFIADRFGPRRTYSVLLVVGAIPVMLIGLANSYESFMLFRLAIGVIGASFVLTQFHTSLMFAPNVIGTANATTAGWGNVGGGITQMIMPLVLSGMLLFGLSETLGWRLAMVVPGIALMIMGFAYYKFTQDTPEGNFEDLHLNGRQANPSMEPRFKAFMEVISDRRVWALFVIYGACFGLELTINNIAALYYHDRFGLSLGIAGAIAGLFGLMNIFARTLGGMFGDKVGIRWGLRGRVWFLGIVIFIEGLALVLFSQMALLVLAIPSMILFGIFVQMASGATYSVVPFINRRAMGTVAGIVGAGGNLGAVAAGFLFKVESIDTPTFFLFLGLAVIGISSLALTVRFSPVQELEQREQIERAVQQRMSNAQSATYFGD
jgi:NNP family nitrate/nitrite transporter-like MFS transporter